MLMFCSVFILGKKEISIGSIVKEVIKIINKETIMILPKSITGFISENIKDPKATIVVKAVYKHGKNIFFNVSFKLFDERFFFVLILYWLMICIFIEIESISIRDIKFAEIAVISQFKKPFIPIITMIE